MGTPIASIHGVAKAVNLAEKDREHDYADADETRAEDLAGENEDLTNDLAGEEETRQNAYATADAGWLLGEAAAQIASTSIAAGSDPSGRGHPWSESENTEKDRLGGTDETN